ncbi:MAG: hypothetical protein NT067_05455 [Candidatus Diapherotrites archaeon]|nr:hypothetical protein [Candidatus Diapherotrites archaeon]
MKQKIGTKILVRKSIKSDCAPSSTGGKKKKYAQKSFASPAGHKPASQKRKEIASAPDKTVASAGRLVPEKNWKSMPRASNARMKWFLIMPFLKSSIEAIRLIAKTGTKKNSIMVGPLAVS